MYFISLLCSSFEFQSFTAIIGPNGSGKSNVIDSMLFVFGYRATKIRSKKISVLIHSSSKFPNITSATVAVHFCQIIDGVSLLYNFLAFHYLANNIVLIGNLVLRYSS